MGIPATLLLSLGCPFFPQEPAETRGAAGIEREPALAVLVERAGDVAPSALRLGDGGLADGPSDAEDGGPNPGRARSRGGILIRTAEAGVKLDFPSGTEMLFVPDGRLHLRTGEHAGPFPGGIELTFADGDRLQIRCSPTSRRPLREVVLVQGERGLRIWRRGRADRELRRPRPFHGASFVVCGEGDALYRAVVLGPLTVLERGLCSEAAAKNLPVARIAVARDVLVESLKELPGRFPRPTTEYPQVDRLAAELAVFADALFGRPGRELEPQVFDGLHFGLSRRFSLSIDPAGRGPIRVGLHVADDDEPLVEWSVGTYSELHVLNPDRGGEGATRYYRSGIRLPEPEPRPGAVDLAEAREILQSLLGS